jgi:hypothetical protein
VRVLAAWSAALVLAGALVAPACTSSGGGDDHEEIPTCEAGFSTPAGFRATESFQDPYPDHVGIRLGFVDDGGRELHYFAGIPGEFGEGLPVARTVEVALGVDGTLQGKGQTWVLSWRAPGPCGQRAALGTGFSRRAFLETLRGSGAIPAG